ncbi:hypothetical protein ACIRO1_29710 [Streptomyces sp. NPDC102381]|uniref:hypothetical protein n=1 Tax=Streptomyces sp. NPDC102381 TaxID=3366164 RepID=UPI00381C6DCF
MVSAAAAAAVLLVAGDAIGRLRPYRTLADWTHHQLRARLDRWQSTPRQAALAALLLLTDPA